MKFFFLKTASRIHMYILIFIGLTFHFGLTYWGRNQIKYILWDDYGVDDHIQVENIAVMGFPFWLIELKVATLLFIRVSISF